MDEAGKQRVKDALIALLEGERSGTRDDQEADVSGAELDQNEPRAVDDLSQSDEAGEMHGRLNAVKDAEQADIDAVRALDVSPRTTVEPGAIVELDGSHYLVGVVASSFECDGVTYEGMSSDSPMYEAAHGTKAGDTFTFRDREHRVGSVD